jgi:hypothetical protein
MCSVESVVQVPPITLCLFHVRSIMPHYSYRHTSPQNVTQGEFAIHLFSIRQFSRSHYLWPPSLFLGVSVFQDEQVPGTRRTRNEVL